MQQKDESLWEATSVQNLFRYRPSGTYFARFKVGGKPIRQSLETTVFSVAKQRLPDKMREHRTLNDSARSLVNGKMTVGEAAQVFLTKVDANVSLKPRTKAYYRMLFDFIKSSWPTLAECDVRKVTDRDCEAWIVKYQGRYPIPNVFPSALSLIA